MQWLENCLYYDSWGVLTIYKCIQYIEMVIHWTFSFYEQEERPCSRGRCIRKKKKNNFHIIKKKKLSQRTRGFLKFNRAFYTRWTKWSQCSDTCKTLRSRYFKWLSSKLIYHRSYRYSLRKANSELEPKSQLFPTFLLCNYCLHSTYFCRSHLFIWPISLIKHLKQRNSFI